MTKRRQAGEVESARRDEAEELRSWRRTKTGGEARGGPATVVGVEAPARCDGVGAGDEARPRRQAGAARGRGGGVEESLRGGAEPGWRWP